MADNITLDSMSGGSVVATDDIAGIHYQIIKLAFGALDAQTIVSASNGLPVTLVAGTASIGTLAANSGVDIGDVTINNAGAGSAVNVQDGGNSLTVDATNLDIRDLVAGDVVTVYGSQGVALQQKVTSNDLIVTLDGEAVVLGAGAASIGTLGANSGVDIGDVTLNNGTGAGAVNIQDGGNSITVDSANLVTIAGAVAGTEMQVDVVGALPAGTNAIGKLAANSGVDIGDVDVTSLPAIPAGTNAIGKLLPPDIDVTAHTNYARKYYTSAGAATDGIVWSPAAGKRWHVTSLIFQTSADATVTFEDDKAGGDDPVLKGEFKAGSGLALTFDEKYPFASGEDAADLTVTTSAGNIYVSVVGYEI